MAASPQSQPDGAKAGRYLTFFLGSEEYGVEIHAVREINGFLPITPLPQMPPFLRGVVNLRGRIIPVADLRVRFAMPSAQDTRNTCIIITQVGRVDLGMVVDQVSEVIDLGATDVVDAPALGSEIDTEYLVGIGRQGERVTLLLDMEKVFPAEDLSAPGRLG